DPEGRRPLSLAEAARAQSFQLTEAGYYQIRLANGKRNEVGVNPDPKESNLEVMPDDAIALWQGKGSGGAQEAGGTSAAVHTTPESIWWYVMLAGFLAALAESVLSSRYLGTQREEA
ncbi:MAG TPA: hypothetical protein VEF06_05655, partial [Bryobacteraceae bacterium]|nr:hypothetical protein [Bryobacteraceae bacterium]